MSVINHDMTWSWRQSNASLDEQSITHGGLWSRESVFVINTHWRLF